MHVKKKSMGETTGVRTPEAATYHPCFNSVTSFTITVYIDLFVECYMKENYTKANIISS